MSTRIEQVKQWVKAEVLKEPYLEVMNWEHLYGTACYSALLAKKRGANPELATITAWLHDIARYQTGTSTNHARLGAQIAKEMLEQAQRFTTNEIAQISTAIRHHSAKEEVHDSFSEILKDADVLDHFFMDVTIPVAFGEEKRLHNVFKELALA